MSVILATYMICFFPCSCNKDSEKTEDAETKTKEVATTAADDKITTTTASENSATTTTTAADDSSESGENVYKYDHMTVTLPYGFTVYDNGTAIIASPETATGDNIVFTKSEASDISNYTKETVAAALSAQISGFGGIVDFEQITVSGHDCIAYTYTVTVNEVQMQALQLAAFGEDYTDVITLTSVTGTYDDAFTVTLDSILIDD